jgi:choline kinase
MILTTVMQTVFITTSGLGTRLESLTQITNKALVKIGDKYAICHIIDRFPRESTRFVITVGYYGKHVRDFLTLAYPEHAIEFVEVDNYAGPGSSQAYSMLQAAPHLQTPFLYHCCDTILPADYHIPNISSLIDTTLFVSPHSDYISYSGITAGPHNSVARFNRKREAIHDYAYIGLAYIRDPHQFWNILQSRVAAAPDDGSLGDTTAYTEMTNSLRYTVVPAFFDTGNLDSLRHARRHFAPHHTVLEKSNESLCFLQSTGPSQSSCVIKFIHSAETNRRRLERATNLSGVTPQILGYSDNFIKMAYVEGTPASECRKWGTIRGILEWAEANLWTIYKVDPAFRETCRRFYVDKTRQRIAQYFQRGAGPECNIVNGLDVGSVEDLLAAVPFEDICTDTLSRYHGDFILDNIMVSATPRYPENRFVVLDWREAFDDQVQWGDIKYDLAKLRHNIVFNHANVVAGMFEVHRSPHDSGIVADMKCNYLLMRQLEEFDSFVRSRGWNVAHIRILQAIIWLNMAPLYEAPLSDFLFYFGKFNLALALSGMDNRPQDVFHGRDPSLFGWQSHSFALRGGGSSSPI